MTATADFADYAVELLGAAGRVAARRMFGGYGLYCDGVMFALIADDVLYLKADDVQPARARARRLRAVHLRSEGPPHDHGLLACAGRRDGVTRGDGALGAERARRGAAGEGRAPERALTAQSASQDEGAAP